MCLSYSLIEEFVCLTEHLVSSLCYVPTLFYWCISFEFAKDPFEWLLLLLLLLFINTCFLSYLEVLLTCFLRIYVGDFWGPVNITTSRERASVPYYIMGLMAHCNVKV
jgi:hypothetical protein